MNGKVALITGGAKRIGAETARTLHDAGMNIIIHYRSSRQEADELSYELNQLRENSATAVQADLDDDKLDGVADRIKQLLERVTAEIRRTKDFNNLEGPLESAYEEVKRLVDELSKSSGDDGGEPP